MDRCRPQSNRTRHVVSLLIGLLWYLAAIGMNADLQRDAFSNAGRTDPTATEFIAGTWSQERPRLPAPHQILAELDKSLLQTPPTSKRSLAYHALITIEATLLGFVLGSALGIGLSILVVHSRSLDRGMLPWIVASQTVPVVALAPMIVVILNQFDVTGIMPKALIAAYLSFFPVTVGMVKGLRSPDPLQRDPHAHLLGLESADAGKAASAVEPAVSLRQPEGRRRRASSAPSWPK